jgi:hypothetical protein
MQHLVQLLHSDTQTPNEAFVQAARSTNEFLREQIPYADEWGSGCTVLGGLIENDQAWISWFGSESAWHFRHASLIAATTPHTFGNAMAAAGHPLHPDNAAMEYVAYRALRSDEDPYVSYIETLEPPWTLLSGDILIFVTVDVIKHLNPQQVAQHLEGKNASQIAQMLMNVLPEGKNHVGAAAIVIRVQDP